MKKTYLILSFIFFSATLISQVPDNVKIEWSEVEEIRGASFMKFINSDKNHFYTLGWTGDGHMVRKYNKENYQILDFWKMPYVVHEGVISSLVYRYSFKNQFHFYYVVYHTELNKKFLFLRTLDKEGNLSEPQEITSVKSEAKTEGNFRISYSADSSFTLILTNVPTERKDKEVQNITVLKNAQIAWEREITFPYTDKFFGVADLNISNKGDVILTGYSLPDKFAGEKQESHKKQPEYNIYVITADPDSEIKEFKIDLGERYVNQFEVAPDFKKNTLLITGFYSMKSTNEATGYFYITLDQNSMEPHISIAKPFEKELLTKYMKDRKADEGYGMESFIFRKILPQANGGIKIIAEQSSEWEMFHISSSSMNTTKNHFYNGDILVLSLDSAGNKQWIARLPKTQVSVDDKGYFSGYAYIAKGDNLYFVYNAHEDDLENLPKGYNRTLKVPRRADHLLATIDEEGQVKYASLFRNKDFKINAAPNKYISTMEGELIYYAARMGKMCFFKLTVQ